MNRPSIRDLMARVAVAKSFQRMCRDADWNDANRAHHTAERELLEHLTEATGLDRAELRALGGLI